MRIPQEFIDQLKKQIDLIDLAAEYFDLHKANSIYQANCPHGDKRSRSLTFFPDTQTFYCFGCGAGSKQITDGTDIISFVQWVDNCSFQEAVTKLANMRGLKVPRDGMTEEDKKRERMMEKVLEDNRSYWGNLQKRSDLLTYLAERGIGKEEVDKWRIGYVERTDPTKAAGRLAFAIINDWGRTVGFSFRNMEDHFPSTEYPDTGPKYINSPKSAIFDKGSLLYGLNFIKKLIREKDYVVITEGFGDAILGQRYGLPFVSIMGTSLTSEHIKILSKYTDNVYVWLDGDAGGINAALRHLDPLRKEGFLVKVILTPNQDPDDVIMEQGENLEQFIVDNALMVGQFEIGLIMNKYRSQMTELKLKTIQQVQAVMKTIERKAERQVYAGQIAHDLGVDVATLLEGVDE